jgi:hypothetical protein
MKKTKNRTAKRKTASHAKRRTRSSAIPTIPYFTRDLLIEVSEKGLKWNYNRQISEQIAEVPDLKYPVIFHMPHHHRQFKRCEEHVRCVISLEPFSSNDVICDVPIEFFIKLPRVQMARRAA